MRSLLAGRHGHPCRKIMVLITSPVAALALAAAVPAAQAAADAQVTALQAPVEPCAALTGLSLPGLPGSDTATVSATEVLGSGCRVGIEITDTSDPLGGQPGSIGIDLTLPDSWNGS